MVSSLSPGELESLAIRLITFADALGSAKA